MISRIRARFGGGREANQEGEFLEAAGLTPIHETSPDDVFIAGYPKSGNTWFQNLAAGVLYGIDPSLTPDVLIQDLIPDVHFKKYYRRYGARTWFKSHHLPQPQYRKVVYLVRDGRDVMVSYFHHLSALAGKPVDLERMIETGEGLDVGKWHEHVEQWCSNPYGAEIITIRYEDLKRDASAEVRRFCDFMGLERSDAVIERAVAGSRFEVLKAKEAQFGWANTAWPKEKAFIRRGKVGSYRDEMPGDLLDQFLAQAGPTLERLGYLTAEDRVAAQ